MQDYNQDMSQDFDSNAAHIKSGGAAVFRAGKTATRLFNQTGKAGAAAEAATPVGHAFFVFKAILIGIMVVVFLLEMISLGFSCATINEVVHVNNAETLATDKFEFNYAGTPEDDLKLFHESFDFCSEGLMRAVSFAHTEAETQVKRDIRALWGPFSGVIIDFVEEDAILPVTIYDSLFVSSSYSASMDNLLSSDAEAYFNSTTVGNGMGQDIEKKIEKQASTPSTTCKSGNIVIGADYEEIGRYYDPVTGVLVSVTYKITYRGIDFRTVIEKAFDIDFYAQYDANSRTGTTNEQYIRDIRCATVELLGIEGDIEAQALPGSTMEYLPSSPYVGRLLRFEANQVPVIYYNQYDERWKNLPYGTDYIGGYGCGPTSMAIVVSSLTSSIVDPPTMAQWAYKNGHWAKNSGSYNSIVTGAARAWGLNVTPSHRNDGQAIADALSQGKLVVAIMGPGEFTSRGHFIVLRGITADGRVLVADPASTNRTNNKTYPISIFTSQASVNAANNCPFWIISN